MTIEPDLPWRPSIIRIPFIMRTSLLISLVGKMVIMIL